jgi:hypothetical protein
MSDADCGHQRTVAQLHRLLAEARAETARWRAAAEAARSKTAEVVETLEAYKLRTSLRIRDLEYERDCLRSRVDALASQLRDPAA